DIICIIQIGNEFFSGYVSCTTHQPATAPTQELASKFDYKTAWGIVNALRFFQYDAKLIEIN
ncbi:hypothetical protein, partial [Brasilonema octagenarum]|uniref:hypothetical protein n=1 Tax=Brasilonema octagenarum TaxID=417105 RepID=UPI001B7D1962